MIEKIEEWIRQVNSSYEALRQSCTLFEEHFNGFYSHQFLDTAFFVVTDEIPKPDFPELRLHFHELVHVVQWRELRPQGFIERYIREIQDFGYYEAPLENMAYALDEHYQNKGRHLSVEQFVRENLSNGCTATVFPPLRGCVMTKDSGLSCCTQDEGRPLGLGDQTLGSNRPVRLALRVRVVSDRGKGRQERSGKCPRR
ncbi:hypothetical protein [uncultured Marinobacter sp.]|uniref:hypothetical protein n=1 Tax=uncultured Marinobacter sp. TaxID=187379 RepID=UPI0030D71D8F